MTGAQVRVRSRALISTPARFSGSIDTSGTYSRNTRASRSAHTASDSCSCDGFRGCIYILYVTTDGDWALYSSTQCHHVVTIAHDVFTPSEDLAWATKGSEPLSSSKHISSSSSASASTPNHPQSGILTPKMHRTWLSPRGSNSSLPVRGSSTSTLTADSPPGRSPPPHSNPPEYRPRSTPSFASMSLPRVNPDQ